MKKEWGENDAIIICFRWDGSDAPNGTMHPLAQRDDCELCQVALAAMPSSIQQAEKPHFHLVCRSCALGIFEQSNNFFYAGKVEDPLKFHIDPEFENMLIRQKPRPIN